MVSWSFEPSQPLGVTSGLTLAEHKHYYYYRCCCCYYYYCYYYHYYYHYYITIIIIVFIITIRWSNTITNIDL